jgi:hypothetical protein
MPPTRKRKRDDKVQVSKHERAANEEKRATERDKVCTRLLEQLKTSREGKKRGLDKGALAPAGERVDHQLFYAHLLLNDPLEKVLLLHDRIERC